MTCNWEKHYLLYALYSNWHTIQRHIIWQFFWICCNYLDPLGLFQDILLMRLSVTKSYQKSKYWQLTIPPDGPHFQVRNKACQVSEERKCEPVGGTVSSHIIDHHYLFFSHHSANYPILMSNLKMAAIGKNVNYAVKWKINIIFKIILCILVLYLRYKTVNKQLEIMNVVIYSLKWSQVQCFFQMVCFFHVFSLWCNIFRIVMLKNVHVMRVAWISHLICLAHIYNHVRK